MYKLLLHEQGASTPVAAVTDGGAVIVNAGSTTANAGNTDGPAKAIYIISVFSNNCKLSKLLNLYLL